MFTYLKDFLKLYKKNCIFFVSFLQLYMGTNRTTDGQSLVLLDGNSSSNIAFQSSVGQVEIANTSWFSIRALTWRLSLSARLTVASTFSDGHRHLVISVITNDYSIDITVEDGNVRK